MNINRTLQGTDFLNSSLVKPFKEPLSENDIIFLQNQFMQNGIFYLDAINLKSARSIIKTILISLNFYKNVAYVSDCNIDNDFVNIYETIKMQQTNQSENFFEYFMNEFNFDFIWIEDSGNNSSKMFKETIIEFGLNKDLPVILVNFR